MRSSMFRLVSIRAVHSITDPFLSIRRRLSDGAEGVWIDLFSDRDAGCSLTHGHLLPYAPVDSPPPIAATFLHMDEQIITKLKALRPALRAEGVTHLALFGSRARGDNRPDSDIDLLIDIDPESRFSILNLVGVEHIVADATGIPANAFMRRSLDKHFVESVAREAIPVF